MGYDLEDKQAESLFSAAYRNDAVAPTTTAYRNDSYATATHYHNGPQGRPVAANPAWVEEDQPSDFKLKQMQEGFRGEDKDARRVRGTATDLKKLIKEEDGADIKSISTHYMSDAERKATEIGVDANGKILDGSGQKLDTTNASGTGTAFNEGEGKHIFAMTAQGDICQADPWAEKKLSEKETNGQTSGHAAFINHSSFKKGMALAGAGEMRVENGELQTISDQSGHYEPDGEMVGQTLDQLQAKGVNMERTSVKLVDKGNGEGPVYCSPTQFRQHDAVTAEDEIRTEKERLKRELTTAVGARSARLNLDDSEPVREFEKSGNGSVQDARPVAAYKND